MIFEGEEAGGFWLRGSGAQQLLALNILYLPGLGLSSWALLSRGVPSSLGQTLLLSPASVLSWPLLEVSSFLSPTGCFSGGLTRCVIPALSEWVGVLPVRLLILGWLFYVND